MAPVTSAAAVLTSTPAHRHPSGPPTVPSICTDTDRADAARFANYAGYNVSCEMMHDFHNQRADGADNPVIFDAAIWLCANNYPSPAVDVGTNLDLQRPIGMPDANAVRIVQRYPNGKDYVQTVIVGTACSACRVWFAVPCVPTISGTVRPDSFEWITVIDDHLRKLAEP